MEMSVFFLVIGFVIWLSATRKRKRDEQRHEEVMAMVEKGIYEPLPEQESVYRKEGYVLAGTILLLLGVVLSAAGLALLLYFFALAARSEFFLAGLLCLFPGLSLMGSYPFLAKKAQREERNNALQENPPS